MLTIPLIADRDPMRQVLRWRQDTRAGAIASPTQAIAGSSGRRTILQATKDCSAGADDGLLRWHTKGVVRSRPGPVTERNWVMVTAAADERADALGAVGVRSAVGAARGRPVGWRRDRTGR